MPSKELLLNGSAHRAGAGASAAADAGIRVDDVLAVALGDRVHGTLGRAGAAADALVGNLKCQVVSPPCTHS